LEYELSLEPFLFAERSDAGAPLAASQVDACLVFERQERPAEVQTAYLITLVASHKLLEPFVYAGGLSKSNRTSAVAPTQFQGSRVHACCQQKMTHRHQFLVFTAVISLR
jgi:hypothetical protein